VPRLGAEVEAQLQFGDAPVTLDRRARVPLDGHAGVLVRQERGVLDHDGPRATAVDGRQQEDTEQAPGVLSPVRSDPLQRVLEILDPLKRVTTNRGGGHFSLPIFAKSPAWMTYSWFGDTCARSAAFTSATVSAAMRRS